MFHPLIAPITAIVAGILILVYPQILNFVVAIYLILTGLFAILGR